MIRSLNRITLLVLWLSCLSPCKEVHQGPPAILGRLHDSATISCSHSIGSYDTMLWYQQPTGDSELKLIGYVFYSSPIVEKPFSDNFKVTGDGSKKAELHVLKLRHPEDSGVYYCADWPGYVPVFGYGTKLTVLGKSEKYSNRSITPPTVTVLRPSQNECRNNKDEKRRKTLVCVASRFYPDHVSVFWQIDAVNVETDGVATDNAALWEGEHYSITSRLRVPLREWFTPGKKFTCTVSFFNGNETVHRSDWVEGVEGPGAGAIREKYLRITHTAKLSYVVLIFKSSIFGVFVVFLAWRLQVGPT
ncbi:immunoglobulin lambda-1 light chain-like [Sebastes umbrosus]|uniref:immunoglobulin lambda-1 light chain-like n=1 Tax=Sebastes umbrosus TaxID=72105 RepID=UPI0018A0D4A4|nr:immunoglobulin lambda-1 light chain-like [Sebastes umbrosus]